MKQLGLASHLYATDNEKLNQYEARCSPKTGIARLRTALLSAKGATATHDLAADFNLDSNPTASGWGYNVAVAAGGGPVGARTDNWNEPDFGPGQPGWEGPQGATHAGWAKRVDNAIPNGSPADSYDAPVGTVKGS